MKCYFRHYFILLSVVILLTGCSGKGNPSTPDVVPGENPAAVLSAESGSADTNHYLLMSGEINADISNPDDIKVEVVPARDSEIHLNILKFLDGPPCGNCLKVVSFYMAAYKVLQVDIQITHPIPDPDLTVFDCRAIMMFEENLEFWNLGKTVSFPDDEHGGLLNPEGYSSLYYPGTESTAPGPLFSYYPGKLASEYFYDAATCNPYRRHISSNPANTRNAFYSSDNVVQGYDIQFGEMWLTIGYAVDVSWAMPLNTPVDDPMTDFGLDANCSEPWKIEVTEEPPGGGINQDGGETKVIIDVYDWQGSASHTEPVLECNMSMGLLEANWVENTDEYSRYEAILSPQYTPPGGFYPCLIAIEDNENDPVNEPWLDQTAYQLYQVRVEGPPIAQASADSMMQTVGTPLHFFDDGSYDADGGDIQLYEWDWDNDGSFDETGADVNHIWNDLGTYYVQFRVTDDEGHTGELYQPLEITIVEPGIPANPIELTPDNLNFYPYSVAVDGNFAYVASYDNGLHIFN
ncbi:MAG: PKD domain-containing protein, partial [bacterium]|nr:PKD domain-containing protein [bacterium]